MLSRGIARLRDHARYGYDADGALAWVEGLGAATRFDYRYDLLGRPDSVLMPGGVREKYLYDTEGRLKHRRTTAPAGGSWWAGGSLRSFGGMFVLGMMNEIEESPIMFQINVADKGKDWRSFFQGGETCASATQCRIDIDNTQATDRRMGVRFGHELGGAVGRFRGIVHISPFGSELGETLREQCTDVSSWSAMVPGGLVGCSYIGESRDSTMPKDL